MSFPEALISGWLILVLLLLGLSAVTRCRP